MTTTSACVDERRPDATLEHRRNGAVLRLLALAPHDAALRRTPRRLRRAVEAHEDDALTALLQGAAAQLRAAGCELAAGPVDGDTWHHYRLVTWSDGTPAFTLEPFSPLDAIVPWSAGLRAARDVRVLS